MVRKQTKLFVARIKNKEANVCEYMCVSFVVDLIANNEPIAMIDINPCWLQQC